MWIKSSEPTLVADGKIHDQCAIDLTKITAVTKAIWRHGNKSYPGINFYSIGGLALDWGYTSEEVRDRDHDSIMRMLEPTDLSNHNPHALSENPYTLAKNAHNKLTTKDSISYGDFEMGFVLGYTAKS